MTLELEARPDEVMRAVRVLETFARERCVPERTIFGLALALEESGSNVVNHALKKDPRQRFTVSLEHTKDVFIIELRDPGPAFDPTRIPSSQPSGEEDGPPGGWGTQLIRRYIDEIKYRRDAGENVLCLSKRLSPDTHGLATENNTANQT